LATWLLVADTLLKHLDGIANYCRTKVRMGVVEAVNGLCRFEGARRVFPVPPGCAFVGLGQIVLKDASDRSG